MNEMTFKKLRHYFWACVTVAIWSLLVWDHFHGGVPSHHILANKDLPAVSNWWGGILLPILTWFLLYRIQKNVIGSQDEYAKTHKHLQRQLYGFSGALLFGVALSVFFTFGYADICGYMILGLFLSVAVGHRPTVLYIKIMR